MSKKQASTSPTQPSEKSHGTSSTPDDQHGGLTRRNLFLTTFAGGAAVALSGLVTESTPVSADSASAAQSRGGKVQEYWISADAFQQNLVPTGVDGMMGTPYTADQTTFWALGYRAYTANWGQVLPGDSNIGPNTGIPGPILRGNIGDTIRVHFRNNDTHYNFPHSIHAHGLKYPPTMDGTWSALDPNKPGTALAVGQNFTYEWQVDATSVGTWAYNDLSKPVSIQGDPIIGLGHELGLFGIIAVDEPNAPKVDHELIAFFHDIYQADIPSLPQDFDCFNGCSFLGNTPTFHVKQGQHIRWRVAALGKEFHVFHLHGHRWVFEDRFDDSLILGPGLTLTFDYVEDNPGTWLWHCHVTDHMMGGMVGQYISDPA